MARRGFLAVLLLAAALFLIAPAFAGIQSTIKADSVARTAVLGQDSQGRYRFYVDGVIPEVPSGGGVSSMTGANILAAHFIIFLLYKISDAL
mmetsp:Transcript_10628/g.18913  ORF Transcript_10628/g.18913 Transcript_10628/m.18913 type:complete len:92 (+) Transcript_10628:65-340(+)|eukprot:CAMPEP_0197655568 /NCGR_PEP_ID=MMETSP1338-20131121/39530_1 /TAXON_ID=43686 ORGANISM="Pelagodinium beii, Strain RCC1491" /NCGR_SAMPLE_ID=MMETSP1338 /ASSEMBLY_ACC=CAM_ASM_000754 /LENGTH=91 /DNA_ID=CAMNT_0043231235 /DNA_START=60 /DNA_END=335 /DNA_ORIENTATION=-